MDLTNEQAVELISILQQENAQLQQTCRMLMVQRNLLIKQVEVLTPKDEPKIEKVN